MIFLPRRGKTVSISGTLILADPLVLAGRLARWVYVAPPVGGEPTWGTVSDAIYTHFKAQFESLRPTVPIAWDNVPFQPPADAAYVAIRIEPAETTIASLGGTLSRWRSKGAVVVDVYTPHGEDTRLAFAIAGDVVEIWRATTLESGKLAFRRMDIRRVGINEQQNQYQLTVAAEFYFDALLN